MRFFHNPVDTFTKYKFIFKWFPNSFYIIRCPIISATGANPYRKEVGKGIQAL